MTIVPQVKPPNLVPRRDKVSSKSLSLIGIPKEFHSKNLNDFKTDSKTRKVKKYVENYICTIRTKPRDEVQKGIFFCGSNGVGKTMLSSFILREAYICRYTCRRLTFSQYVKSMTDSWNNSDEVLWIDSKVCDYLCLEEIGKEVDSKLTKPTLEELLRFREERGLTTIICTNLSPKDIFDLYGSSIQSLIRGNMERIQIVGEDVRANRI